MIFAMKKNSHAEHSCAKDDRELSMLVHGGEGQREVWQALEL